MDEADLFRSRLEQILNPRHPLFALAGKLDWPACMTPRSAARPSRCACRRGCTT